mgnify:CR=1 FL=1
MFRRVRLGIRLTLLLLLALALLTPEWPAFGDPAYRFGLLVAPERRFDYVAWTTQALADKAKGILDGSASDLSAEACLLYTSPSPRDRTRSRMPSSA